MSPESILRRYDTQMMGPSHRVLGSVAWLGAAPLIDRDILWWQLAAGILVAGATAHGRLSPDADRYPMLGRVIPGGHRGVTHWWPLPLVIYLIGVATARSDMWSFRVDWIIFAVAVAWASHDVSDFVFGKIPIFRKRRHWKTAGLGFRTGGAIEKFVAVPLIALYGASLALNLTVGR